MSVPAVPLRIAARDRADFVAAAGVVPDPFQTDALDALDRGESVLVAAPTGAGKTFVADYAVYRAVKAGAKTFYTTPLKALSNQKFRDLALRFGDGSVGLLTGDRAIRPHAPIVVMTTEVLRALLYDNSSMLRGLASVVMDEFHYIQDHERGPAWEEVVMHVPPGVALVCLSATMGDTAMTGAWLRDVHGPTAVIEAEDRPVPLNYLYAIGHLDGSPPVVLPAFVDGQPNQMAELFDGSRRRQDTGVLRERSRTRPCPPERHALVAELSHARLLPAIWFLFSRAGCDRAVAELTAGGARFTSEEEAGDLEAMAAPALGHLDPSDRRALGYRLWLDGLRSGIAAHHGGLLPAQREVVEQAAAAGLLKIVFATETLALGVNLPARTVIVDRLVRDHGGGSLLSAADFSQLAGRAGRRGLDTAGTVVVPWSADVPFQRVVALAGGQMPMVESRFRVTPTMAANLIHRHGVDGAKRVLRRSLLQCLRDRDAAVVQADLAARASELAEVEAALAAVDRPTGAAVDSSHRGIADFLSALQPGDVFVDPGRPARSRLLVVDVPRRKRGEWTVDAVGGDARRVAVGERDFRQPPVVVARVAMDEVGEVGRGFARRAAAVVAGLTDAAVVMPREQPIHHRPRNTDGDAVRLRQLVAGLESRVDDLRHAVTDEFTACWALLVHLEYVVDDRLTDKGATLRRLFHPSALVVAEALHGELFDGLDGPSLAALASCFTGRRRNDLPAVRLPAGLRERVAEVQALSAVVERAEASAGLTPSPPPDPSGAGAVQWWASGWALGDIVEATGAAPGDLIREIKQAADLLREISAVAPLRLTPVIDDASGRLLRGVVTDGRTAT